MTEQLNSSTDSVVPGSDADVSYAAIASRCPSVPIPIPGRNFPSPIFQSRTRQRHTSNEGYAVLSKPTRRSSTGSPVDVVNLHGLFPQEMPDKMKDEMYRICESLNPGEVRRVLFDPGTEKSSRNSLKLKLLSFLENTMEPLILMDSSGSRPVCCQIVNWELERERQFKSVKSTTHKTAINVKLKRLRFAYPCSPPYFPDIVLLEDLVGMEEEEARQESVMKSPILTFP